MIKSYKKCTGRESTPTCATTLSGCIMGVSALAPFQHAYNPSNRSYCPVSRLPAASDSRICPRPLLLILRVTPGWLLQLFAQTRRHFLIWP